MPEYINYVLLHAGSITTSHFVEKFLECKRDAGEKFYDFVDAYSIALDELTRYLIGENEEVLDFLLKYFRYGDYQVAKREACMIESKTGWT